MNNQSQQLAQSTQLTTPSQARILIHLIARTALAWGLVGFALMLVAEVIFPGFISRIIPTAGVLLGIAFLLALTTITQSPDTPANNQTPENIASDKSSTLRNLLKTALIFVIIFTPFLLITLRKFSLTETIVITILTLITLYYLISQDK